MGCGASQTWARVLPLPSVLVLLGKRSTSLSLHCLLPRLEPARPFCRVSVGAQGQVLLLCRACSRGCPFLGAWAAAEGPFLPPPVEHPSLWGGRCPVPLVGVGPPSS